MADLASSERALQRVETSLSEGVSHGERSVCAVRILASVLVFGSLVATEGLSGLLSFEPRSTISSLGLLGGTLASLWVLWRLRSRTASLRDLFLSVSLDTLIILVTIAPVVYWPRPDYPGVIHLPPFYFFAFVIALAGMRLERSVVHWATLLNGLAAGAVYAADVRLNGPTPLFAPGDLLLGGALFTASAALGHAIAGRTRSLVIDGAAAVLKGERARQALGVYVSEEVAIKALAGDGALQPGGERRQVAVLFSDLRGFTAYADKLPPEQLVAEINAYLDRMVEVIRAEGGVVDKYIGDAIMVVFGIPESQGDDAVRAARCAAAMQAALDAHNAERLRQSLPTLRQGIGVHYGPAIAGNIGSADRLQYTVMGSVVNEASRLESATKTEGVPVLLSAALFEAIQAAGDHRAGSPDLTRHGVLSLRGAAEPMEVYTLA